jgi:hypothetical protein
VAAASLRGAPIQETIAWIRRVYGDALFRRALDACSPEMKAMFSRPVLPSSLYPLAAWDPVLDAVRREVRVATGEDEITFDRRNIFESSNQMMRSVYSFLLSFMDSRKVVAKAPVVWKRMYPDCTVAVTVNEVGRCALELSGPGDYRTNAQHHFSPGLELLLDMSGARSVRVQTIVDVVRGDEFVLRVEAEYDRR